MSMTPCTSQTLCSFHTCAGQQVRANAVAAFERALARGTTDPAIEPALRNEYWCADLHTYAPSLNVTGPTPYALGVIFSVTPLGAYAFCSPFCASNKPKL